MAMMISKFQGVSGLLAEVCRRAGTPPTDPTQALDVEKLPHYTWSAFPTHLESVGWGSWLRPRNRQTCHP